MTMPHRVIALSIFGALFTALGCSSTPAAKSPGMDAEPIPVASEGPTTPDHVSPDSDTTTAVNIDDAILKACGIAAPHAYFAFDSANLRPGDTKPLEEVATCFISGPLKGRSMQLVGHADPRGESEYNMVLGQSRADRVASFLRSKGVKKAQLASSSRGAMDASGSDEPSWARDRRVDLMLKD